MKTNENQKVKIDHIDIQDIYAFMETGKASDCPEEIQRYLVLLDKIHGMHLRKLQWGTEEHIIKHLEITEELSQYKCRKLYNEMLEYFYSGSNVSKQVYRNMYAKRQESLALAAEMAAKTVDDFDKASKILERAAKARQLDLVDPPVIPKEAFAKPIKIYAMDADFLGEEPINRLELARQIDSLEGFSKPEKALLKQDAGIEQIKVFNNEQEEFRKSER